MKAALLECAYERCAEALAQGELVCIFPEGKLTRTGEMNAFRHGVRKSCAARRCESCAMAPRGL